MIFTLDSLPNATTIPRGIANINVKINFDKVNMLSIRDYKHESGFRYVPCASCMIPCLNMKEDIKREIGIISHKDYIIENNE